MATDAWKGGGGNWNVAADWSAGVPTATSDVVVAKGDPSITTAINIASLKDSSGVSFVDAGSSTIFGSLVNAGVVDLDALSGDGGSNLTVAGALANAGLLQLGAADNSLSKTDTVKVASLVNTVGDIEVAGGKTAAARMILNVTGARAGFGAAGVLSGTVDLSGHSSIEFTKGGQISQIANQATLEIDGANAFIAADASLSNDALSGLNLVAGTLTLADGAKIATSGPLKNVANMFLETTDLSAGGARLSVAGGLTNDGSLNVEVFGLGLNFEPFGFGGSSLTVAGVLTNNDSLSIGSAEETRSTTVTVLGLVNDHSVFSAGNITLASGSSMQALTLLKVAAGAAGFGTAGVLSGEVSIAGDAGIQFAYGKISTIASQSALSLSGPLAFIADSSAPSTDSALTGLKNVEGTLSLANGAALATSGALVNASMIQIDTNGSGSVRPILNEAMARPNSKIGSGPLGGNQFEGGSSLTIGGVLTNDGLLGIGNSDLTAADLVKVAGLVNGGSDEIDVTGNEDASIKALLDVTTAAGFGTQGEVIGNVRLSGDAEILFAKGQITAIASGGTLALTGADASIADADGAQNSALKGLANIAGALDLDQGAELTTAGPLVIAGGSLNLADGAGQGVAGLSPGGPLTNNGNGAGGGGADLSLGGALTNNGNVVIGNAMLSQSTTLKTTKVLNNGTLAVTGNSSAAELALLDVSGAAGFGTTGVIQGNVQIGGDAEIEFQTGGITSIARAGSLLLSGAKASIADQGAGANSALAGLATVSGSLMLENGANLSLTSALTNDGNVTVGFSTLSQSTTLTTTKIVNNASLSVIGNTTGPDLAFLRVTSGAGFGSAGIVQGNVMVEGDAEVVFQSGGITRIAGGLTLIGADASVADKGWGVNSALSGLKSVSGNLGLQNGAVVQTKAALTIGGSVDVDGAGSGGSSLVIGGVLTVSQNLTIGNSLMTEQATVKATGLVNTGQIAIDGDAAANGRLLVAGSIANSGGITIEDGADGVIGASVSGSGSLSIDAGSTLELDSSVANGQSVSFGADGGSSTLVLGSGGSKSFGGTLENFAIGDTIDARGFGTGTTLSFSADVLSLTQGANQASFLFNGQLTSANFSLTNHGTDSLISFV
jgi:hypothetical protein